MRSSSSCSCPWLPIPGSYLRIPYPDACCKMVSHRSRQPSSAPTVPITRASLTLLHSFKKSLRSVWQAREMGQTALTLVGHSAPQIDLAVWGVSGEQALGDFARFIGLPEAQVVSFQETTCRLPIAGC